MNKGNWNSSTGEMSGLPVFLRVRDDVEDFISAGKYRHFLKVVWKCAEVDESGIPAESEWPLLANFENNLREALESDDQAVLTFVLTNDGLRQWLLYARDVRESIRRIDQMPKEKERYPIELTTGEDSNWKEYKSVADIFNDA